MNLKAAAKATGVFIGIPVAAAALFLVGGTVSWIIKTYIGTPTETHMYISMFALVALIWLSVLWHKTYLYFCHGKKWPAALQRRDD